MAGCENCPYAGTKCIDGIFNGGCDLLIVGEAPGATEIEKGTPFMGPSGKMLHQALTQAGFDFENMKVSLTNAMSCRPPEVIPQAVMACRGRLLREIEQEKPRVILAFGNHAVHSIRGEFSSKITQIVGSTSEMEFAGSKTILVPAIHPASVLRKPGEFKSMLASICQAVKILQGEERVGPSKTSFFVVRTREDLEKALIALYKLPKGHLIGADIETTTLDPYTGEFVTLGMAWEKNKVIVFSLEEFDKAMWQMVKNLIEDGHFQWGWHLGKFDLKWFLHRGIRARLDWDSGILHYALNEEGAHDLESLSVQQLGAPNYKTSIEKYRKTGWVGCPRPLLWKYQAEDCDFTRQLIIRQRDEIRRDDPELEIASQEVMIPGARVIARMELNGMNVSRIRMRRLDRWLAPQIAKADADIQKAIADFWPRSQQFRLTEAPAPTINPNSWQQVGYILFDVMKTPLPRGVKKKSTAEPVLVQMYQTPFIKAMLAYREVMKKKSTYVEGWEKRRNRITGRVHPSYHVTRTKTGRLASTDPNGQNIDRNPHIRGMITAPPGKKLLEADLKSAEIVVLANLSQDPELCAILNSGRNLHHEVAVSMYGPGYTNDQYFRAKAVNFGVMYGRGAQSLVSEYGHDQIPREKRLTVVEAQGLIDTWDVKFPVAMAYIRSCRAAPGTLDSLQSPVGRRRRFGLVTRENLNALQNEAANFPIQSTASDIVLVATYELMPIYEELGVDLVNLIHDASLNEVWNKEHAAELASYITPKFKEVGERFLGNAVPFTAEYKIGMRWGSLKKVEFHAN